MHPKQSSEAPKVPFESENEMAEEEANLLRQNRESSGNLPDSSTEDPVKNTTPYKKLAG
jgi:hypothetical protein